MADPAASLPGISELSLGDASRAYDEAVARARDEHWPERLFDRDASLWSSDGGVQASIGERLGWLDAPAEFAERIAALEGFGEGIRQAGFRSAIVMGMGGSSLAPEVFREVFGSGEDWATLRVLDSTDPAAVAATVDDLDPLTTLWIVASKSGTTTEPLAFQADAWRRAEEAIERRDADEAERYLAGLSEADRAQLERLLRKVAEDFENAVPTGPGR